MVVIGADPGPAGATGHDERRGNKRWNLELSIAIVASGNRSPGRGNIAHGLQLQQRVVGK
jgi:hypothetical protein